jgi:DNA-binding response OmpR family regulator
MSALADRKEDAMPNGYTLVVEDDNDELDTIFDALVPDELVIASDGSAALHAIARRMPGAVVIDLDAPHVRELRLPQRLRAHPRTKDLPIVTMVSSPLDVARAENGRIVSDWFVRKPCGSLALAAAIEAARARHA